MFNFLYGLIMGPIVALITILIFNLAAVFISTVIWVFGGDFVLTGFLWEWRVYVGLSILFTILAWLGSGRD